MEKLISVLRKLGIIRFGSYKWKGDAKDRPIEAIMDNVYDAEKDLINKKDIKKVSEALKSKKKSKIKPEGKEFKPELSKKILSIISHGLGVFFILLFLILQGFSFWFLFICIVWGLYIFHVKKFVQGANYPWKKMISILLVITLSSFILMGWTTDTKDWKNFDELTFSTNFEWDATLMDAYAAQETALEASYAGPFFFGEFDGVNKYTQMYSAARNDRVDGIIDVMDESINHMNDLEDLVREQRGTLDWYMFKISTLAPGTREVLLPYIDKGTENAIYQNMKLEFLNSLNDELSSGKRDAEWGFLTYSKYVTILDLVEKYTNEIEDMNKILVTLYYILEENNEVYQEINDELDDRLESNSTEISQLLHNLNYNSSVLMNEEKLLFTADYYFAKDTITFIEQEIITFDRKISEHTNDTKNIDADVFDFLKGMKEKFVIYKDDLKKYLESIPEDQLLHESDIKLEANLMLPTAHAWGNPFTLLKSTIKAVGDTTLAIGKAGASMAWSGAKIAGSGVAAVVKGGAKLTIAGAKTVGTVVGVGLDVIDATVKTGVDIYQADNHAERVAAIKNNYTKVATNFKEGKSGAEIYNNALKGLEGVEIVTEQVIAGVTSHLLGGPGYTSKTLGFLAKVGVGFFTGLAKDAYTILDPQKSDADTYIAIGSMMMTFFGGSNSVMKGSQAINITKTVTKQTVKKAGNIFTKLSLNNVKGYFKGGIVSTMKRTLSGSSLKTLGTKTKDVMIRTKNKLVTKGKDGLNYLKGNAKKEIPDVYDVALENAKATGGFVTAFKDGLGMMTKEGTKWTEVVGLFDNFVGAVADDSIKAYGKDILKDIKVSDTSSSYKGLYASLYGNYEDEIKELKGIGDVVDYTKDSLPIVETEFDLSDYIVPVEDYPEVEHIYEEPIDHDLSDIIVPVEDYPEVEHIYEEPEEVIQNTVEDNEEDAYWDDDWDEEYEADMTDDDWNNTLDTGFGAEDICIASGGYIDASGSCEFEYNKSTHENLCASVGGRADPAGGCIYGNEPVDSSDNNNDINWDYDCSYCHENDSTCLANCLAEAGILR